MRKSIVVGLSALYFFVAVASGQVFDPDPSEANAQQAAESRAAGAFVGMAPPPIGWNCTLQTIWHGAVPVVDFVCEPDVLLIEQQERERQAWERRLVENSRRVSRSRR